MTALLLVGASGLAREVGEAARAAGDDVAGVLDDNPATHDTACAGATVLGGLEVAAQRSERIVVCVGSGQARADIVVRLVALGVATERYATVVHPAAYVGDSVTLGVGSVLLAGVIATADIRIGQHVALMPGVVLTHDCVIDDFVTCASGVQLGGSVRLSEGAYLGIGALVHPGCTIGPGALVGMGSVVLEDIPARQTWAGTPARRISQVSRMRQVAPQTEARRPTRGQNLSKGSV